jgi:hypothetical protein
MQTRKLACEFLLLCGLLHPEQLIKLRLVGGNMMAAVLSRRLAGRWTGYHISDRSIPCRNGGLCKH